MKHIYFFLILVFLSCGQKKKYHDDKAEVKSMGSVLVNDILQHRKNLNEEFKNPETSPLPDRYRKNFEALDFFAPDTNYRITAKFKRTPDAVPFLMSSTTSEKTTEVVYGESHF